MKPSIYDQIRGALLWLVGTERGEGQGFGQATFEVDIDGRIVHQETVVTVKMNKGEPLATFIARIQDEYDWQPGDGLTILAQGGKYEVARITLKAR